MRRREEGNHETGGLEGLRRPEVGDRLDDDLFAFMSPPMKPRDLIDVSAVYTYDVLAH